VAVNHWSDLPTRSGVFDQRIIVSSIRISAALLLAPDEGDGRAVECRADFEVPHNPRMQNRAARKPCMAFGYPGHPSGGYLLGVVANRAKPARRVRGEPFSLTSLGRGAEDGSRVSSGLTTCGKEPCLGSPRSRTRMQPRRRRRNPWGAGQRPSPKGNTCSTRWFGAEIS
jgi:hypothetical protein